VLDLQRLAARLGQRLVVRHLGHHVGHLAAEVLHQLLVAGVRVLDGVVQHRGHQRLDVGDAALGRQQPRQRDRVVDVGAGAGVLAALVAVLVGGEFEGDEEVGHLRVLHLLLCYGMGRVPRHAG